MKYDHIGEKHRLSDTPAPEWVDWFNNRRLLEPIGNIPPKEFEMMYYERQEVPAMVVGLK